MFDAVAHFLFSRRDGFSYGGFLSAIFFGYWIRDRVVAYQERKRSKHAAQFIQQNSSDRTAAEVYRHSKNLIAKRPDDQA